MAFLRRTVWLNR